MDDVSHDAPRLTRPLHYALGVVAVVVLSAPTTLLGAVEIGLFVALPVLALWGAVAFCEAYFAVGVPVGLAWVFGMAAGAYAGGIVYACLNYDPSIGLGYFGLWTLSCIGSAVMSGVVLIVTWRASRVP